MRLGDQPREAGAERAARLLRPIRACAFLCLMASRNAPSPAQVPDTQAERIRDIDAYIEVEMAKKRVPGLAVAIISRGEILYAKGYGVSDMDLQIPVKLETVFRSGSTGKQFTAMAVMMLAAEGRLGYDDSIRKFFPDAPEAWQAITIRRLLNHTSGLGGYFESQDLRKDYSDDELRRLIYGQKPQFKPGEKFLYSNLGYTTLGLLIGRITGKPYGEYLHERIFRPLGMETARIIDETANLPGRSLGYVWDGKEYKRPERVSPTFNGTADGSLYLTLADVAKWDGALYTEKLVSKAALEEAWTSGRLGSGAETGYGFGWYISRLGERRVIEHSGHWQGFSAMISRYPDDQLTVAMFANLAGLPVDIMTHRVAALWNPALAQPSKSALDLARSIRWVSQGALVMTMGGKVIFTDPFELGAGTEEKADIILITHDHFDHYSLPDMKKAIKAGTLVVAPFVIKNASFPDCRLLKPGESMTASGVKISAIPAYNVIKTNRHPKSKGYVGYLIEADGLSVYVAGDTERVPEMKSIDCDIAFLPLGPIYTMSGPEEAAQAALDVKAEIAIPYHWGPYEGAKKDAETFAALLKGKATVIIKEKR
jgi:D-alanyl-D-alanine carboxypeptidase